MGSLQAGPETLVGPEGVLGQQAMGLTIPPEPRTGIWFRRMNTHPFDSRTGAGPHHHHPYFQHKQLPRAMLLNNLGAGSTAFQSKSTAPAIAPGQCPLCRDSGQSCLGALLRTSDHEGEIETVAVHRGAQEVRTTHKEGEVWASGHPWRNSLC